MWYILLFLLNRKVKLDTYLKIYQHWDVWSHYVYPRLIYDIYACTRVNIYTHESSQFHVQAVRLGFTLSKEIDRMIFIVESVRRFSRRVSPPGSHFYNFIMRNDPVKRHRGNLYPLPVVELVAPHDRPMVYILPRFPDRVPK